MNACWHIFLDHSLGYGAYITDEDETGPQQKVKFTFADGLDAFHMVSKSRATSLPLIQIPRHSFRSASLSLYSRPETAGLNNYRSAGGSLNKRSYCQGLLLTTLVERLALCPNQICLRGKVTTSTNRTGHETIFSNTSICHVPYPNDTFNQCTCMLAPYPKTCLNRYTCNTNYYRTSALAMAISVQMSEEVNQLIVYIALAFGTGM